MTSRVWGHSSTPFYTVFVVKVLRENDFLQSFDGHQLHPLKGIAFYQLQGLSTCGAGPRRSHLAFWQKFQKNITETSKSFWLKISKKFLKEFKKNSKRILKNISNFFKSKNFKNKKNQKKDFKKFKEKSVVFLNFFQNLFQKFWNFLKKNFWQKFQKNLRKKILKKVGKVH